MDQKLSVDPSGSQMYALPLPNTVQKNTSLDYPVVTDVSFCKVKRSTAVNSIH